MKIAVVGFTGFVGTHLMNHFGKAAKGYSLRNRESKLDFTVSKVVINLVGKAHDHKEVATEQDFLFANVELVKEVFAAFLLSEAQLLIHISSIAAIEELESKLPLTENTVPRPNSWYGKSKLLAEKWLTMQPLPANKKLVILRPPMIHGENDKGNLGLLYKVVSKGVPYPLGAFKNRRSFLGIGNFCFILDKLLEQMANFPSGIYHVADDEQVSTNEIIHLINREMGKTARILRIPQSYVRFLAKIGDKLGVFFNTIKLEKMTSDLIVDNGKIKATLKVIMLPMTAEEGLQQTIRNLKSKKCS